MLETDEKRLAIANRHAEAEGSGDMERLLATMEGEPEYFFFPIGRKFRGMANTRRFYEVFFKEVAPRQVGFRMLGQRLSETGVVNEYVVTVRHDDGSLHDHHILAVLTLGKVGITGERIYADDVLVRIIAGSMWEAFEVISGGDAGGVQ